MVDFFEKIIINFYFFAPFAKSLLLFCVTYPLIRYSTHLTKQFFNKKIGAHLGVMAGNVVYYVGIALLCITILNTLGLNVAALLGAAGVLGIAIGFAAQTSISNIISGVFLLVERPFSINDEIECDNIKGIVEAIDPLSVKLRTQSNQLVRIPNETLIKKSFINHTFYDSRRIQIPLKVRSQENIDQILQELVTLAKEHKEVLQSPIPCAFIIQVTSLSTNVVLRCWVKTRDVSSMEKYFINMLAKKYAKSSDRISIG